MNKLDLNRLISDLASYSNSLGDVPITRTKDWYLLGDSWEHEPWSVHARERIGGKDVAVVSVQFSAPRDGYVRVKASPRTCQLIDEPLETRPTVFEAA